MAYLTVFIEAFRKCDANSFYRRTVGVDPEFYFTTKVCVEYLARSKTPPDDRKRGEDPYWLFIKKRELGNDAFSKNDPDIATMRYIDAIMVYPRETFNFFREHIDAAEERKKWWLCYKLCDQVTDILAIFIEWGVLVGGGTTAMAAMRARRGRALRRNFGLGEELDRKILDGTETEQHREHVSELRRIMVRSAVQGTDEMSMDVIRKMTEHLCKRQLTDVYSFLLMDSPNELQPFLEMSDFRGKGNVTVDEFSRFWLCMKEFFFRSLTK